MRREDRARIDKLCVKLDKQSKEHTELMVQLNAIRNLLFKLLDALISKSSRRR
jgi:hypothetical protein